MFIRENRVQITIADWLKRPDELTDATCYVFSNEAEELGLDPWRSIDSVDPMVAGTLVDLWFA
ncbi:MAG: DUF2761 domain-containing protein, partial [Candidatus Obscuribacterales bacterium]|nr:DUF2761 domain-containing protein [Candidatus Obscuribacterales bacterium]